MELSSKLGQSADWVSHDQSSSIRKPQAVSTTPQSICTPEVRRGSSIYGKPPAKPPLVRHLLCNMSGLPGDFLAESMLKRFRKGAGKAEDANRVNEIEKGNVNTVLSSQAGTARWPIPCVRS